LRHKTLKYDDEEQCNRSAEYLTRHFLQGHVLAIKLKKRHKKALDESVKEGIYSLQLFQRNPINKALNIVLCCLGCLERKPIPTYIELFLENDDADFCLRLVWGEGIEQIMLLNRFQQSGDTKGRESDVIKKMLATVGSPIRIYKLNIKRFLSRAGLQGMLGDLFIRHHPEDQSMTLLVRRIFTVNMPPDAIDRLLAAIAQMTHLSWQFNPQERRE